MKYKINILIVEDSEADADLMLRFLVKEKFDFNHLRVWSKDTFVDALNCNEYDIIISDQSMPQFSGMEAFRITKQLNSTIPFILVTGTVSETLLTDFIKEGIDDYIFKENLLRLPTSIRHSISTKKIELLHKKLELAHKDIKDSINYATKIQNAMLPDEALLKASFPESFILFKPKDSLSGDFYWFKKEQDTFYIAAADCTGHGIPGALMSMIGIEKLNSAILNTAEPSDILNQLNKNIEIALCLSTQHEHSNDGMDIGLCSINSNTMDLKFAGANRPLWIVRQGTHVVEEVKGTKKAIGGNTNISVPGFENNDIVLNKGDCFYLFSDGYVDQFGGKDGKKIMTKKFKEILLDIQSKSMAEQKIHLNQFIESWKESSEQVDDILVIGVRV